MCRTCWKKNWNEKLRNDENLERKCGLSFAFIKIIQSYFASEIKNNLKKY